MDFNFPKRKDLVKDKISNKDNNTIYDEIVEKIKSIDIDKIEFKDGKRKIVSDVIEKQKEFLWLRVFLKDELGGINIGDEFTLSYILDNGDVENMKMEFISYGKNSLNFDSDYDNIISNYDSEFNNKKLIFMVDKDILINNMNIRKLFKNTIYYEDILLKRDSLLLLDNNESSIEYVDMEF